MSDRKGRGGENGRVVYECASAPKYDMFIMHLKHTNKKF